MPPPPSPPRRIDAHVHIWHPPTSTAFPPAPDRPPPPTSPPGTPADLAAILPAGGVTGAVIIQPINYGFDHTAIRAALAAPPPGVSLAGVALAATPGGPVAAAAALKEAITAPDGGPPLAGVRLNPTLLPPGEGLGGPTAAAVVATAGTLGVPVTLFARPPDGDGVAALAAGHPSVGLWVDHWGFCRPVGGEGAWGLLLELAAAAPRVGVKLSAAFRVSNVGAPYGDLGGWAGEAVAAYGPDRLMWGSDWPYVEEAGGYAAAWAAADVVLAGVGAEERGRILGGTAAAVYGL